MEVESIENLSDNRTFKYNSIERINGDTIHRICSGQVVLSLAIAVKELVENAIDASATNIEVRLNEYGSELFEVSDNGTGVHSENFQALTIKHCTSKLRAFKDLEFVETLGFRGEALSSLCALSELLIVTRHASAEHATKIKYDVNGVIIETTPAARDVGTTVTLSNLFFSLPVRRKEFMKNLKREYSKMCQLLQAYCLVSKGIKFKCSNFSNGSRSTVISTEGSNSVRDNIISLFGPKQIQSLVQIKLVEPNEQILDEYKAKLVMGESLPFNFDCFISNVSHGSGRSTSDRQFFYINSRPCEPHKLSRLINSIYKQFNANQYPFVYLNVNIKRALVDVNVTPDKRQIFVNKEALLLAALKTSLLEAFEKFPSTYALQNLNIGLSKIEGKGSSGIKRSLNGSIKDLFQKRFKSDTTIKRSPSSIVQLTSLTDTKLNITKIIPEHEKSLDELIQIAEELDKGECNEPDLRLISVQNDVTQLQTPQDRSSFSDNYKPSRPTITICTSMKKIEDALAAVTTCKQKLERVTVNFHSQITPLSNKAAENELQKQITKDKFKSMSVIGQFNLGFIIAQLEEDLFIIDQHASDEKYNFEYLQINTSLDNQVLVNPKPLELSSAYEELLIENHSVFKKNGFRFTIDSNAPATKKIYLTSIPMSKNYIFGKNDIEEMLFMLQEGINPAICRPSRIQLMFATRACRKSVMVGCPLSKNDMRRIIDHMGDIEQPWNCPHGRPTMRHLINLKLLEHK